MNQRAQFRAFGARGRAASARAVVLAALALTLAATGARAQQPPLEVRRVAEPIRLDGRLDDAGWVGIEPLPAFMFLPANGAEPTERTEFLVAYDDDYLYFGGRLYMADPALTRATSLKRDDAKPSNDFFVVLLDCFRDGENVLGFGTNPAGIRWDGHIPDDAATQRQLVSWNAFWDVAVTQDDDGWFVELRVPLSTLRFQPVGDEVTLGLTMMRWMPRKGESVTHPAISDRWGMWGMWKASQTRPIVLRDVQARRAAYLTPYGLAGTGVERRRTQDGGGWERPLRTSRELGLDVKYGLTSNLTLDATLNPDFAQVEADDQQVNLTRFSLFFPEKRLFFQERGAVFEFGLGGSQRLFYSRRVGLDAGRAVPILGGGRLVGRVGEWDVGAMTLQTRGSTATAEGAGGVTAENLGVVRLRRRVLNEASYVGGLVTSRVGADGAYDVVAASDANLRAFGQDFVTVQLAHRATDGATVGGGGAGEADGGAAAPLLARVLWERRGTTGWSYSAEAMRAGARFDASLGYLPRRDFTHLAVVGAHGWRPGATSGVLDWRVGAEGSADRRNRGGELESGYLGSGFELATKIGHQFSAKAGIALEDLEARLALPRGTEVQPGRYHFPTFRLTYDPPWGRELRLFGRLSGGGYYDGRTIGASIQPSWTPSPHLELGAFYRADRVEFPERGQAFTAHVARLSAGVMPNVRLSCFGLLQYSSAGDVVVGNIRLRYNPREGNDLYLVYNHVLDTGRDAVGPLPPRTRDSALLVKYSRTFVLERAVRRPGRASIRDGSHAEPDEPIHIRSTPARRRR
jgi:hypothetical protein